MKTSMEKREKSIMNYSKSKNNYVACVWMPLTSDFCLFQALGYYDKAIQYNPKDESAFLNRAITKVSKPLVFVHHSSNQECLASVTTVT